MEQFGRNLKILCATVFLLMVPLKAMAAEWATITADRAVVYSDVQMSSEIGYISKGKKVRVGEVKRNKGRLLPIVINGKIAYLKVEDIENKKKKLSSLEMATERYIKRQNAKEIRKRVSIFGAGSIGKIYHTEKVMGESSKEFNFTGAGFRGYYHHISSGDRYRASFSYHSASTEVQQINYGSLTLDKMWPMIKYEYFDFSYYLGGSLIPLAQYSYDNFFTVNSPGLGAQMGLEMRFNVSKNFSLHLDGGYQYLKFLGFELPENPNFPETIDPSYHSFQTSLNLSYEI